MEQAKEWQGSGCPSPARQAWCTELTRPCPGPRSRLLQQEGHPVKADTALSLYGLQWYEVLYEPASETLGVLGWGGPGHPIVLLSFRGTSNMQVGREYAGRQGRAGLTRGAWQAGPSCQPLFPCGGGIASFWQAHLFRGGSAEPQSTQATTQPARSPHRAPAPLLCRSCNLPAGGCFGTRAESLACLPCTSSTERADRHQVLEDGAPAPAAMARRNSGGAQRWVGGRAGGWWGSQRPL